MSKSLRQLYNLPLAESPLLFLAPMAGFTNAPMRRIAREHGANLSYTEVANDMGLLRKQPKSWHLLERFEGEEPLIAHLYGSNPESLAEAAQRVEEHGGFAGIDLNAGCPVPKITRNGAGAALINNPWLIYRILCAMRKVIKLPLSLKTRVGAHPGKTMAVEILKAAEDAGADLITFHARFTSRGHSGDPDLSILAEVKSRASIPVVGNGGIRSAWDAQRMFAECGVDAVMIARRAIGNPWIFSDIREKLASGESLPVYDPTRGNPQRDLDDLRELVLRHLFEEYELIERNHNIYEHPEGALATRFRCHLVRYLHGLKGSSYLRGRLSSIKTIEDITTAVDACIERERVYRANKPRMCAQTQLSLD